MGKASRWFRGLLGLKKSDSSSPSSRQPPPPPYREKRRWSFVKSHKDRDDRDLHNSYCELENDGVDPERQVIAVAPATAAVSEAAIAAAQAAACAVTLMSSGRCFPPYAVGAGDREEWAALKIQSAFRGYLVSFPIYPLTFSSVSSFTVSLRPWISLRGLGADMGPIVPCPLHPQAPPFRSIHGNRDLGRDFVNKSQHSSSVLFP